MRAEPSEFQIHLLNHSDTVSTTKKSLGVRQLRVLTYYIHPIRLLSSVHHVERQFITNFIANQNALDNKATCVAGRPENTHFIEFSNIGAILLNASFTFPCPLLPWLAGLSANG